MEGWVKLYRKTKDHWLWGSERRLKWWLDILLTVNYTDSKVLIRGSLIDCKRGQSIRSLETWAKDWGVSKKTVKDFFLLLQKDNMIEYESVQISTRITVCNYDTYQDMVHGEETQSKRKVNAKGTQPSYKQERQEREEGKEIKNRIQGEINSPNSEPKKINLKPVIEKIKYSEFVSMQEIEFKKLEEEFGQVGVNKLIEILNNYKGSKGKKYKSDYLAIRSWVIARYQQDQLKDGKTKNRHGQVSFVPGGIQGSSTI